MATHTEAAPASAAAAPSRLTRNLMFICGALALAAAAAAAAVYFTRGAHAASAPTAAQVKPIFVNLEPVTVNLQSDGRPKFLHLGVTLKVADEDAQARVNQGTPDLRSRLLLLLSNRDPATLSTPADKAKLAGEIASELNRPPAAGQEPYGVTGVAFNAFVIQ